MDPQWYALRVQPQKEYVVAFLLRKRGVSTFVPTEIRSHKRSSYAKGKVEFAVPVIPGCVFAGFGSPPAWYDVLRNHLIIGPEGRDGKPWRLDFVELLRFFATSTDGCMVLDEGLRLIHIPGRQPVRSLTTRVRTISPRKRMRKEPDAIVHEVSGRRADFLSRFLLGDLVN